MNARERTRRRRGATLPMAVLLVFVGACDTTEPDFTRRTYEVAPHMEVCSGLSFHFCLRVRAPGESTWDLMFEHPSGFSFEWGVTTRIVVDEQPIDPPPLDASAVRRTLVRIDARDTVPADTLFTLVMPGHETTSPESGLFKVVFGDVAFRCDEQPDCTELATALAGDDAVALTLVLGAAATDPFRVVAWHGCGAVWPGCEAGGD